MQVPAVPGAIGLSLAAFPVSYALNCGAALAHPVAIAVMGVLVLLILFCIVYLLGEWSHFQDPLFYVFTVFSFTSVIDLIISLEEDGYIGGFMEFYLKEGEPYLRTAYGIMICYWDGIVHYLLYLAMIMAITQRKNYRTLGLYWLGSLMMSIVVFLPGTMLGKYSSEIRPSFLLNVPYILIPIWAGMRLFSQPKSLPCCTAEKVAAEQQRSLYQRPLDLGLILFLMVAAMFTFFRGLVVLDCPSDSCFDYIYQYEPYLRDPVAYPKVQAQFSHVGSSLHHRTPYPYRTPEEVWWVFLLTNVLYALGPHLLAYRCLCSPGFFQPAAPTGQDGIKKRQ